MTEADERTIAGPERESIDETVAASEGSGPSLRPFESPTAIAPTIGRYSILRKLGAGGMGVVYAGYDEELDRKVAIKLLLGREQSPARRQRLQREAQGLARLSHPNVVQVYEIGEHEGAAFIAMEYVDGSTLGSWLAHQRPSSREIVSVFIQAGRGLAAAHQKGLVHRDFKPDNVMIAGDGRVLVMDFGLVHEATTSKPVDEVRDEARQRLMSQSQLRADALERSLRASALSSDLTATGAMMGTPAYMAPEQFAGWRTDARSDQFSYCVALWEALCGERPFAGESITELCTAVTGGQRREPPRSAALPGYLRKILLRGLATDPRQRWPSMDALIGELAIDRARRRRIALAVGVPLLVSLAAGIGWQQKQQAERVSACEAAGQAITEVWNHDARARIDGAFAATQLELATDAWARTSARLDDYASQWSALRVESCRVATIEQARDPASAARVDACLTERLAAFTSLLGVLEQADAELIPRAVSAAAELPLLGPCNDDAWLAHRVEEPDDPRARERIAALRSGLEQVDVLLTTARYDQAEAEAAALLSEAEAIGWSPIEAEARHARASIANKRGDFRAAEAELERVFFAAGEAGHDLLALHAAIGLVDVVGDELERHEEGLRWGRIAAMLLVRLDDHGGVDEARLANHLGNVLESRGSFADAQREYQRAQGLYQATFGPDHPSLATTLNNIGIVQRRQGQLEAALATQLRALELREATLGPEHPAVGDTSTNIANILFDLGRPDEALKRSERALAIWLPVLGERHQKIGYALNSIGNAHFAREQFDEALDHYRRALAVWEAALGPEHSTAAMALTNIGNVLLMKGELDEALTTQQQALARTEASLGPDHFNVAEKLNNVAIVLAALGRLDEALDMHRRSLDIRAAAVGPDGLETAYSLQNVGATLVELGRPDEAREYLERALAIREAGAVAPLLLAEARFELARALWELDERERATRLATAAHQACKTAGHACADAIASWQRDRGIALP
ncbi:MAG TPA: serine/threonine-protein kinase [Enhygromyxa sp.]|nr:serine/threonine-protein kinase [Enhygromyxa sp.]